LAAPVQRRGPQGADRPTPAGPPAHLHGRTTSRGHRHRADGCRPRSEWRTRCSTTWPPTGPPTPSCSRWPPRWEFVFQPVAAAYLTLIEPLWKVLRSLALKGRRFESWQQIEAAVERATGYWNAHRHPFVWGRRRRHRPRRSPGIAAVPGV